MGNPTEDEFDLFWSELVEYIDQWLLENLRSPLEQEYLDYLADYLDWHCCIEGGELLIFFRDYDVVFESAGQHWYRKAIVRNKPHVQSIADQYDLALDLDHVCEKDDIILAFHGNTIFLVYSDDRERVGEGEGDDLVSDLDMETQAAIRRVQDLNRCQCTLCLQDNSSDSDLDKGLVD